ncbi:uncharacterized protein V6R79_002567 [Siganus canaliculatus]
MELQKLSNGNHLHDAAVEGGIPPEEEKFLQHKTDESKRSQFTDFEGKTSFGMSVFNLSNAIMGSGILGLSYAMSNTGIVLFLILLTCIACLSCYSVHLLLRSAGVVGIRAYEQLGLRAFGHPGKILAAVIITLHNIGAMSSYLFIVKSELPLVIQAFLGQTSTSDDWFMNGNYLIIIVTACIILPLTLMKHLGYLGYTSGFSLSCMVFFLSAVIYKRFNIACPLEVFGNYSAGTAIPDDTCSIKFFTINQETAYTIPILAFAFVCHPEVLPIYTELSNPTKRRMQNIGNVSILGMFTMYFFTAIFGYLTFYENTEAELLHTYTAVSRKALPLAPSHRHCPLSAVRCQPVGHPCAQHTRHLWHHWSNHCTQSDLYSPWIVLHPHHSHQRGAHELQAKDPGCLLHSTGLHFHDHESNIHWDRVDDWRKTKSWRSLKCEAYTLQQQPTAASRPGISSSVL